MMNKSILYSLLLLLILISFNCTVSKRHYRKGYQIVWHRSSPGETKRTDRSAESKPALSSAQLKPHSGLEPEIVSEKLSASVLKFSEGELLEVHPKKLKLPQDSCADVIIFRDGAELTVKVVEIFNGTVKYLPCNNLDGPLRVANGEKIFMIKYANGTKEVFQQPAKTETPAYQAQKAPVKKKKNGLAVASFILSMFWFIYFIPAIVAFILGLIALNQMREHPDMYDNKWMAKFGIGVGIAVLAILFLALIGA